MKEIHANVRDFIRNYRKFIHKKETIIITKNGIPEGVFVPYEQWTGGLQQRNSINIADIIDQFAVDIGDPHLSEKIDDIVYKYPNNSRDDNS